MKTVAVIGASSNRNKFGNKAFRAFQAEGHKVIPINPNERSVEGVPTYPDAGRFWKMIQDHKVTVFYTAPTAIRSLIKAAESNEKAHPRRYDLASLRILGSVGEPINPGAESDELIAEARRRNLNVIEACSIVGIGHNPYSY